MLAPQREVYLVQNITFLKSMHSFFITFIFHELFEEVPLPHFSETSYQLCWCNSGAGRLCQSQCLSVQKGLGGSGGEGPKACRAHCQRHLTSERFIHTDTWHSPRRGSPSATRGCQLTTNLQKILPLMPKPLIQSSVFLFI